MARLKRAICDEPDPARITPGRRVIEWIRRCRDRTSPTGAVSVGRNPATGTVGGIERPAITPLAGPPGGHRTGRTRYLPFMPVIIIGADSAYGTAVARALARRDGEVRAFVTDPGSAQLLRDLGIKVAVGDVSDGSHIEGAAHRAFTAVLIAEAAGDGRERSFARSFDHLMTAWADALQAAGVERIVWVGPDEAAPGPIRAAGTETACIDTRRMPPEEAAREAVRLDDLADLS